MISEWKRHYSSAFQDIVFYCPYCGVETMHPTPYCPMCGKHLDHGEENEGQVGYTMAECRREK